MQVPSTSHPHQASPMAMLPQPVASASRTRLTVAPRRTCAPGASWATRTSSINHSHVAASGGLSLQLVDRSHPLAVGDDVV